MDTSQNQPKLAAVIVAAGSGTRMGGNFPKQYALIDGKTMLERSVEAIAQEKRIDQIVIVISPADLLGQQLKFEDPRIKIARVGGATRTDSIKNGIAFSALAGSDWVLTHDAARPCVRREDIERLIDYCLVHDEGAILAVPVNDTLKKVPNPPYISQTVSRDDLWCAQTPQCFKVGPLSKALTNYSEGITDEASAMEAAGFEPAVVEGSSTNIKVTRPADLKFVKAVFAARAAGEDL